MSNPEQSAGIKARWWSLRSRENFLISNVAVWEVCMAPSMLAGQLHSQGLNTKVVLASLGLPALAAVSAAFLLWPLVRQPKR